jgi:transposase InsO family protein
MLLSLDQFEALDKGNIRSKLWKNVIQYKGIDIPVTRKYDAPFLNVNILSGVDASYGYTCSNDHVNHGAYASARTQGLEPYDLVHRLCGHANAETCKLTAEKAEGLPSLYHISPPDRPCPECALGKMKQPSKGQGHLSTGLCPDRAGAVLCGDCFGPLAIPGLGGERYFIVLVDQFSRWGIARAFSKLDEVPTLIEEMINEIHITLGTMPGEIDLTLHTDNASVFKSKRHSARMAELHVRLHYANPYEPRTNPFAERYGGVLITAMRAILLEGSYPPRFWSVLLRIACWILNHLVRKDLKAAPVELFNNGKKDQPSYNGKLDFSNIHPTGTLCYWSQPKKLRDDPKLGNASADGVYIGPAAPFGAEGHLVYTTNDRLRTVSHILVD